MKGKEILDSTDLWRQLLKDLSTTHGWKSKSGTEVQLEDLWVETITHTEFYQRVQSKQECHNTPVRCAQTKQNITPGNPPRNLLQSTAPSVTQVCVWGSV
jgi:hypothetical protein